MAGGFKYCDKPKDSDIRVHITVMETFSDGKKCIGEIYTEEADYLCKFSNGKSVVLSARYTEFRNDSKSSTEKTVIGWHWVDYPYFPGDVEMVEMVPVGLLKKLAQK